MADTNATAYQNCALIFLYPTTINGYPAINKNAQPKIGGLPPKGQPIAGILGRLRVFTLAELPPEPPPDVG